MDDKLTPADPKDIADTIAFSLKFEGRKRVHDADAFMAAIVAQRIVRHLERAGFVIMRIVFSNGSMRELFSVFDALGSLCSLRARRRLMG
jgi:hypothetical protein